MKINFILKKIIFCIMISYSPQFVFAQENPNNIPKIDLPKIDLSIPTKETVARIRPEQHPSEKEIDQLANQQFKQAQVLEETDLQKAYKFYVMASYNGHSEAKKKHQGLEKKLSTEQLSDVSYKIATIFSSTLNRTISLEDLAIIASYDKIKVPKRFKEMTNWYEKASALGNTEAMIKLAEIEYSLSKYSKANKWYEMAAERGILEAQLKMGSHYISGTGIGKNRDKAFHWLIKASDQNSIYAQELLNSYSAIPEKNAIPLPKDSSIPLLFRLFHPDDYYLFRPKEIKPETDPKVALQDVERFQKAAQDGSPFSQFKMGELSENGLVGIEANPSIAFEWFKKSSNQNFIPSFLKMAIMYDTGIGIEQNKNEAIKWYKKAVAHDVRFAHVNLGMMYEEGRGVDKDIDEAIRLFEIDAKKDVALAQYNLGRIYSEGTANYQNHVEAFKWFTIAGSKIHEASEASKRKLLETLSVEQIQQAELSAIRWMRRYKIKLGPDTKFNYPEILEKNFLGTKNDVLTAEITEITSPGIIALLTERATGENTMAQFKIGYYNWLQQPSNNQYLNDEMFSWYQRAIQNNYIPAKHFVGTLYYQGKTREDKKNDGFNLIREAALEGMPSAQYNLGAIYLFEESFKQEREKGLELIRKAALDNDTVAQTVLGFLHMQGKLVEKNLEQAEKWFTLAAEKNGKFAQYQLGRLHTIGNGLGRDRLKAAFWFKIFQENSHKRIVYEKDLYNSLQNEENIRSNILKNLPSKENNEIDKMVKEWLTAHPYNYNGDPYYNSELTNYINTYIP